MPLAKEPIRGEKRQLVLPRNPMLKDQLPYHMSSDASCWRADVLRLDPTVLRENEKLYEQGCTSEWLQFNTSENDTLSKNPEEPQIPTEGSYCETTIKPEACVSEVRANEAEVAHIAFNNKPRVIHSLAEGIVTRKSPVIPLENKEKTSTICSKPTANEKSFANLDHRPAESRSSCSSGWPKANDDNRGHLLCNICIGLSHDVQVTISLYQNTSIFHTVEEMNRKLHLNMNPIHKSRLTLAIMKHTILAVYNVLPTDLF